jgi:hypothetical protein
VAVLSLLAVSAVGCTEDGSPVSVGDSGLTANAWVVPQGDVQRFITAHGGSMPNVAMVGRETDPVVVARVDWTAMDPSVPGRYQIVVLDPSGQDAATTLQTSPIDGRISIGWDGRYEALADRYPWLEATRSVEDLFGHVDSAMSVGFRPSLEGPMWILARFPSNGAIGVARRDDVPIVGAFLTSAHDEHIWWAERLTGERVRG